jgi:hypothetical protein
MLELPDFREPSQETDNDPVHRSAPSLPDHIWNVVFFLGKMLVESVGASYLGAVGVYVIGAGVSLFFGNHVWMDSVLSGPTFAVAIACGAILAYLRKNYLSISSYFSWVVPALAFMRGYSEVRGGSGMAVEYAGFAGRMSSSAKSAVN